MANGGAVKLIVYQVDSFTTTLFEGNPAGVVLNADGLSEWQMQQLAREMNKSETAFIINKGGDDYDIEVRFFTPTREVPICGHATIAAHFVYALEKGIDCGIIIQKTKAGVLPVEIVNDGAGKRVVMTQAKIEYGAIIAGRQRERLLRGLNIGSADIVDDLPIQIVSTGHSKVMIPVRGKRLLDSMAIDSGLLCELSNEIGCNGYYVFTFDSQEKNILISGRMFAPAIGVDEDPVTGNANGPLGAYLTHYGKIEKSKTGYTFEIKQGEAMKRKGYMKVHVFSNDQDAELVKISGNACIAFKTEIDIC
ncbi:MAG: hypothetical protein A2087_12530 [Spirochaetes bacterium GWD1_61_31]|nr:MAG: hypothetical protein A2Y37_11480 [Spirochaetes bacterium GWB1_60_80]OHD33036.1 MAG: hypothetical protein A2004_07375 [Spirochaetes bacterium GWC1_61_12]OHD38371.1 MAG: hypothetical protein A2087_12530 [Spirochaetes bacterium GWD1_61_31]OHD43404.1 MAG: hypothetical protein A2Y35_02250 [Spirochaetes bacterium GWE1_60_18]OHD58920.1 MAG: hypothetical protein A2Y32_10695 [Spirochaetes bacterium GWF1_60_12]HAP42974.1 PhzF family isomerase [Spirochaetaceae bacterium]